MNTRVNVGCGPLPLHQQHVEVMTKEAPLSEWDLVDLYVEEEGVKKGDALSLPYPDKSLDMVYSSHLLEHLSQEDSLVAFMHWNTLLKEGGKLYINVPDLVWACEQVLRYSKGALLEGYYSELEGEHGLLNVIYGNQEHEGEYHKTGFTEMSLYNILRALGYRDVHVSRIVEAHDMGCLIAEATA